MGLKSIHDCEERMLMKWLRFKLPHYMKRVGWGAFAVFMIAILATKFFDGDYTVLKEILKRLILVSLFVVVLSKEKVEDERIKELRGQAFSFSFLLAVAYVLVQPIVNYIANLIVNDGEGVFQDLGDFVILWFLLIVYLMFFHFSKKKG
jgi:hypothetical protein